MTLTFELTPPEEEQLRREASQRGQEMTEYARAVLLPAHPDFWQRAVTPALDAIWDNPEDDVYAELLPK